MSGNWGWFALIVALFVFNAVLGEELLFRGVLLPRTSTRLPTRPLRCRRVSPRRPTPALR
jgi:membrane protease YdiL (CAAX protease family)